MQDLLLSTTYMFSAVCIYIDTFAQQSGKAERTGSRHSLATGAHIFSCVLLSAAYAVHALP